MPLECWACQLITELIDNILQKMIATELLHDSSVGFHRECAYFKQVSDGHC